jgi:choline dehydrogenase-like flavoprotein
MASTTGTESVDVLIIGSGPAGSTYARTIAEARPDTTILMVDVGPKLSEAIGEHTTNMDEAERLACQLASQGPDAGVARPPLGALTTGEPFIWPGLFLLGERARVHGEDGLPAASMSSGVGGMGVYWSGSCPRPNATERIPFIPDDEFESLYARAEQLLRVSKDLQDGDELLTALHDAIGAEFDSDGPDVTPVGFMPMAVSRVAGGLRATGTAAILGPLANGSPTFEVRPDTLVRRVLLDDGAAIGAELWTRTSGVACEVRARRVVVCGDSLRTPQLLFASGLRPRPLGHHLNDHFQMTALVKLHDEYVRDLPAPGERSAVGSVLIPFSPGRRMQGQVVPLSRTGSRSPIGDGPVARIPLGQLAMLGWYAAKDIQYRDAVEFSETEREFYGMPAMTIRYTITDADRETIALQRSNLERSAKVVGELLTEPARAPGGSSLHYQGTVRMGLADDGESVCDPHARVWGVDHLYVGGNGLIPTSTAANPTLTNVALAVRAGKRLASDL